MQIAFSCFKEGIKLAVLFCSFFYFYSSNECGKFLGIRVLLIPFKTNVNEILFFSNSFLFNN